MRETQFDIGAKTCKWLETGNIDDLEQCPACCFVGTIDDFDVMGLEDGHLFCNQCGVEFGQ